MVNVKALAVLDCRAYITEMFGMEAHDRIRAAMTEHDRAIVYDETLTPLRFIDLQAVLNHANAMDLVLGNGDGLTREAMLKELAARHFNGVYRALFQGASAREVVGKLASIWSRYYDQGEAVVEFLGDNRAVNRLINCPGVPPGHELLLIPYMRAVLSLSGVNNVNIKHTRCIANGADCCVFEYGWK